MVLFNYGTREITAKIVYYGPGLCGKTTNLQFVFDSLPSNNKSKMLSLATKTDRTLFFDFLPLDLGKIRGMRTKLQLYTVPGQVFYNSTRQLVLKGADGVVFVADSQESALDANLESLQNLEDNLKRQGIRIAEVPLVIQYNKRDLPNVLSVARLNAAINHLGAPSTESVATTGIGVEQTIKVVTQLVLNSLVRKYGLEGSEPIEKEIQILNPTLPPEVAPNTESVWVDDVLATEHTKNGPGIVADSVVDRAVDSVVDRVADSVAADAIPLVATELIPETAPRDDASEISGPFDELIDQTTSADMIPASVALPPIDLRIPERINEARFRKVEPEPLDRRAADGLVKELTIPINLSMSELRQYRRLRLKITLDVNLLP